MFVEALFSESFISALSIALSVVSPSANLLNFTASNLTAPWRGGGQMGFMACALPVVILVGLAGNAISFVVLVTPQMRKTSVYFYFTVLSISDSIILILSAFKTWLRIVSGFELLHLSNVSCKIIFFLINLSYHTSAWIVVLVTVDRFVAVWLPLKSAAVCTVTKAKVATGILIAIMLIYNTYILFIYGLHTVNHATHCCIHPHLDGVSLILVYLKLFTYCVIPFITIFTFNVLINTKLRQTSNILIRQNFCSSKSIEPKNTCATSNLHNNPDAKIITHTFNAPSGGILKRLWIIKEHLPSKKAPTAHQAKLTQMLVAICIAWILLTLPYCLFSFVVTSLSPDPTIRSIQLKIKALCFFLFYTNHSINFFLYCLVGKRFRTRLKSLCGSNKFRNKQSLKTQKSNFIEMDKLHQNLLHNQTYKKVVDPQRHQVQRENLEKIEVEQDSPKATKLPKQL